MRKFLLYLLLLAVAVSAASCRKAVEKAQRNIRFEGIEKIERQGLTGAEIVVRVMNNTGYKLQLETAEIDVYYADGRVGTVVLREPVEVGIAYALEGRGGPAPVKISRDRMPLSDFLNTFGLTLQDVKNKLK